MFQHVRYYFGAISLQQSKSITAICLCLSVFTPQEQVSDMKQDNIVSAGISDQEKEMAANSFEAFTVCTYYSVSAAVIKHHDVLSEISGSMFGVSAQRVPKIFTGPRRCFSKHAIVVKS